MLSSFIMPQVFKFFIFVSLTLFNFTQMQAQESKRPGTLYISWGYNTEWYTNNSIHIDQPSLNSKYEIVKIRGEDHRGWDKSLLKQDLTIPQYNFRIGYFFNQNQDLAIEINFDHTKFIVRQGQQAQIKGIFTGNQVDNTVNFTEINGFYYFLNNGANFLLFNIVKRYPIYATANNTFKLELLGKVGIGPVIPHVQNSLFGLANDPSFQFGGWNTGIETALKATIYRYVYLELSQKIDYSRYSNLKVYQGTARQNFACYELILSLGLNLKLR